MKKNLYIIISLLSLFCFNNFVEAITRSEFEAALKETVYAYYARGKNIQYNSAKANAEKSTFTPEEATSQNTKYMVCSVFTYNVYYDLLGIYIPHFTANQITRAQSIEANSALPSSYPEVIAYGKKENSNLTMTFYDTTTTLTNPTMEEIIPHLKVGDVLTYTGHAVLVYDIKEVDGKLVPYVIQSGGGYRGYHVVSKINSGGNQYLYLSAFPTSEVYREIIDDEIGFPAVNEGSLNLTKMSETGWKTITNGNYYDEYSILRFAQEKDGQMILTDSNYPDKNNKAIVLSAKNQSRIKYKRLYIEKTVDAFTDDIVTPGELITYQIYIKNNSKSQYTDDLIVTEKLSDFVIYNDYSVNKNGVSYSRENNTLSFNIGKLKAGEEVTISYTVKVKNKPGKTIVSTGMVGDIPSATIKNIVGEKLSNTEKESIISKYNELKTTYNGKELIDEIYKQALNIDYNFINFDITSLVINTDLSSTNSLTESINTSHDKYKMVLNKYYGTIKNVGLNQPKWYYSYQSAKRKADTIYQENFETGDILVYLNSNDSTTLENGEYVYIYIDGEGFVGINGSGDAARNKFNASYYSTNNLTLFNKTSSATSVSANSVLNHLGLTLDDVNYQTLLGKDYYVILRPSLSFDPVYIDGDWDEDTTYSLIDLVRYRLFVAGIAKFVDAYNEFDSAQKDNVDLNNDGKTDLSDLILARKILAGIASCENGICS